MNNENIEISFTTKELRIIESTMEDELSDLLNNKDTFPRTRKYYEANHAAIENITSFVILEGKGVRNGIR